MYWAAGIERDNDGKLCVAWQDMNGSVELGSMERLRSALPISGGKLGFGVVRWDQGSLHSTRDYLRAVEMPHLESTGQTCYLFPSTGGPLVVPAQMLVNAVVGPNKHMRNVLLTPHGPKALMTVFADETGLKTERTPSRMREFHESRHAGAARVQWAQTHPSGARAWASIYARALGGVLDIALPAVVSGASFTAVSYEGRLNVVRLELDGFMPMEASHEFVRDFAPAGEALDTSNVDQSLSRESHNEVSAPPSWQGRRIAPLTDEEWSRVRTSCAGFVRTLSATVRTHAVRDRVGLIREHLAGVPYARLPVSANLRRAANVLDRRLRKSPEWVTLEQVLKETL